jgi:arginase
VPTWSSAGVVLIGVPFDGYGRRGNHARAALVLHEEGIVGAFAPASVVADSRLALPKPSEQRGSRTSLINERALEAMTMKLGSLVGEAVAAGRFPFVYGADCSTLLATMTGLRDHVGESGLVFIDGHEDTMPLDVSEDGEAANTEIGLLLGLTGRLLTGPLRARLPALRPEALAMLGQRDENWRRQFNVGSLRDLGIWLAPLDAVVADPAGTGTRAVAHVRGAAERWWLHVDLDVLDPLELRSQGLPDVQDEPGGLTWEQLTNVVAAALASKGCAGWSMAIYDPDQDPDRSDARRIVTFVRDAMASTRPPAGE